MEKPFPRLLHPAYWRWQRQPAEMFGFWHWTGAEDLRETVRRTGANATSLHLPLHLLKDERARYGIRPLPAAIQVSTLRAMELEFDAPSGLTLVTLLVTTADSRAQVEGKLFSAGSRTPLAVARSEPRTQPHLTLKTAKPLPAGRYRVRVEVRQSRADVWLSPAVEETTVVRLGATVLRGWAVDGEWRDAKGGVHRLVRSAQHDTPVPLGVSTFVTLAHLRVDAGAGIGEHNNAFFVVYPDWFWQLHPQAAMRDRNGNVIRAGNNPWIAMDDPAITDAGIRQMREMLPLLRRQSRVRYWVIGGEQGYPDYFGLPEGDFRPEFLAHYRAWCRLHGLTESGDAGQWRRFRESALVERYALYTTTLRSLDSTRPILIPTHGNPYALDFRVKMGFPIADLAGTADGFEAGPISIDDDRERIHRLTLDMLSGFGTIVAAPRLANKQLNPNAQGGGTTFSPSSARRAVYEALGMGVWHIGLVQWTGSLPDGEWGIKGTPAEAECRRLFSELKQASPWLEGCSRLQPRVGIFISDAQWRRWWQARWTLLYDVACSRGWNTQFVHDAQLGADLAQDVPALVSVDNAVLSRDAHDSLNAYLQAGGKVIAVGSFAERDETDNNLPPLQNGVAHLPDDAPGERVTVVHQTSTDRGAATWKQQVRPLPVQLLEREIARYALLRPVLVSEQGSREWAQGIECMTLTDSVNLLVVMLNRTGEARKVHVSLAHNLLGEEGIRYRARDAISAELLGESLPVRVEMAPEDTRLLVLERVVSGSDSGAEIAEAEQCIARWRRLGADTFACEVWLNPARAHQKAERFAKALALARNITRSLAIKATVRLERDGLRIDAVVWRPNGSPAEEAQARVRLVPGAFRWLRMKPVSEGRFSLFLPADDLPSVYSPQEARYIQPTRGLMLVLDARESMLHGGFCLTI